MWSELNDELQRTMQMNGIYTANRMCVCIEVEDPIQTIQLLQNGFQVYDEEGTAEHIHASCSEYVLLNTTRAYEQQLAALNMKHRQEVMYLQHTIQTLMITIQQLEERIKYGRSKRRGR